jgi:DNA polymerase III delta prime subunit
MENIENLHEDIKHQLIQFYESKKIPNIIFHGSSGTGKRSIVHWFLNMIYNENKQLMKTNIMLVNCAHGKGIKFIREELKFFAKTNIQSNKGVLFKTIVLLNADFLTIDAQSALRRCIELFSINTRFFIIVENKNKLLNPILSRFCEVYIPEYVDPNSDTIINLHRQYLETKYHLKRENENRNGLFKKIMDEMFHKTLDEISHLDLVNLSSQLYESGFSCFDLIEWVKHHSELSEKDKSSVIICFDKVRSEYRCEKLLLLYMFDFLFLRLNKDLKNIGFI